MDEKYLKELFALPIGLKKAITIDDEVLYTSDNLKEKLKVALVKADLTKSSSISISKMIEKDMIVPCFYNKKIIDLIKFKIYEKNSPKKFAYGFYSLNTRKIILILDNNISFGYVSNNWIGLLVIHELMHKACHELGSKFFSIFKTELLEYYINVFSTFFNIEKNKDFIEKTEGIYNFLCKLEMSKKEYSLKQVVDKYTNYFNSISQYSKFKSTTTKNKIDLYNTALITFFKDPIKYRNSSIFNEFKDALNSGYSTIISGSPDLNTLHIQEAFVPSEVISIISEHIKSDKFDKVIKMISK